MSMYEQQWRGPTEQERKLIEIAAEYHRRCEDYDQQLVAHRAERLGVSPREAAKRLMPHELGRSNRHALQVKQELMHRHGLTADEFRQALRLHGDRA